MAAFGHFERDNGDSLPSHWVKIDQYHLVTTVVRGFLSFYKGQIRWLRAGKKTKESCFCSNPSKLFRWKTTPLSFFPRFFSFPFRFYCIRKSRFVWTVFVVYVSSQLKAGEARSSSRISSLNAFEFFASWGEVVWWRRAVEKSFRSDQKDYF